METLLYLQPIHIDYVNKLMINLTPGKKNKFMSRILKKKQKQKKKKKPQTNKGLSCFLCDVILALELQVYAK